MIFVLCFVLFFLVLFLLILLVFVLVLFLLLVLGGFFFLGLFFLMRSIVLEGSLLLFFLLFSGTEFCFFHGCFMFSVSCSMFSHSPFTSSLFLVFFLQYHSSFIWLFLKLHIDTLCSFICLLFLWFLLLCLFL